jgi:hypothetical protein
MATTITRSSNPAVREVSRGLAAARDEQIMQVVAMVDAMPNRGPADQLIAPLRTRLARLRPPRPLRFARLLFLPLDPLIVAAARWRPELLSIPRTVIPVIARAVEADLGPVGQTVVSMIDGHTTLDVDVADDAGGLLWGPAARSLLDAALPEDWGTTGLSAQVHKALSRRIGALLSQADRLRRMTADVAHGLAPPEAAAIHALLADAIGFDPEVQPMLVALLLARMPECGMLLPRVAAMLGQRGGLLLRDAGEQATNTLLDQLEAPGGAESQLGGQDMAEAGAAVRRLTSLLSVLDSETMSPDRRRRLNDVRQRVKSGCEALFTERMTEDLLEPLRARPAERGTGANRNLETAARGLRTLETEARRAGGGATYDTLLGQAADRIRVMTAEGGLDRVEGVRLMEIVAGPEMALALFGEDV